MRTLVIIPARAGSKGVPRKNLRPLRGKPLIAWSIEAARAATCVDRVVVSTDSDEIAAVARRFGAEPVKRDPELARDHVTLDPVIEAAVRKAEEGIPPYDCVLTVQPTSPLLKSRTIDSIVGRFADPEVDTVLTAVDDTHLSWTLNGSRPEPDYVRRLNRQQLPKRYRETGGVLATRRRHVTPTSRFGPRVELHELPADEGIDIDTSLDWLFAEAALGRRNIAFCVIGSKATGLGHVTRAMTLMENLTGHNVRAFVDPEHDLAIQRLADSFFPFEVVERSERMGRLSAFGADIVIHDELDTRHDELQAEKSAGMRVVCFEDRGAGVELADLVFNALYPSEESTPAAGRYYGPDVYILRDEFFHVRRKPRDHEHLRVLVTFGGTDPSGLTFRVLGAIGEQCPTKLVVVAGKGFTQHAELDQRAENLRRTGTEITILHDVALMSDVMKDVEFAFSSAGRTVYELAYMQVPTIVLAQNDTELKHTFAGPDNGCLNLGLGSAASDDAIRAAFTTLAESPSLRHALSKRMGTLDLVSGRTRVTRLILELPCRT